MENIYLITSNSIYKIKEETNKIVKDNPVTTYDLNIDSIDNIIEEASYFSVFDEQKYIVVKNAKIFQATKKSTDSEEKTSKKDDILLKYLEDPNPQTTLIFEINGNIDSKKKIVKAIKDRYKLIQIADLKPKELNSEITAILKEKGYKTNYDINNYIINACQNNYDLIINEINKIDLYYQKGCQLTLEKIMPIVSTQTVDNNFKFIDSVLNKELNTSMQIYDDLLIQKVEPIMLLIMLSKDIRNILLIKRMIKDKSKDEIKEKLGIKFDFQIDKLINISYSYKEKELENYLLDICNFDYKIKTGKMSSKLALYLTVLKICK